MISVLGKSHLEIIVGSVLNRTLLPLLFGMGNSWFFPCWIDFLFCLIFGANVYQRSANSSKCAQVDVSVLNVKATTLINCLHSTHSLRVLISLLGNCELVYLA